MSEQMRVTIKRSSKKQSYTVEKRSDGHYYITSVPSSKSSIKEGDRVLEINGIPSSEFKSEKAANDLFERVILDIIPDEDDDDDDDSDEDLD
eukprot:Nitzschia sp. Nitz4//scaffold183_size43938//15766//16125//NITZ4_007267-RA/size43938-augustus-gene-0.70-mRNA-1//1//CDS//3329539605//6302//frame0